MEIGSPLVFTRRCDDGVFIRRHGYGHSTAIRDPRTGDITSVPETGPERPPDQDLMAELARLEGPWDDGDDDIEAYC